MEGGIEQRGMGQNRIREGRNRIELDNNKKWKEGIEQGGMGWDGIEQNRIREGRNRIELDNNKKWKEGRNRIGRDGMGQNRIE